MCYTIVNPGTYVTQYGLFVFVLNYGFLVQIHRNHVKIHPVYERVDVAGIVLYHSADAQVLLHFATKRTMEMLEETV